MPPSETASEAVGREAGILPTPARGMASEIREIARSQANQGPWGPSAGY